MSATALATSRPLPVEEPRRRLRPVTEPAPRRRPKLLYGIVAVAGAVLIGAIQMGLSILTTQTSYEISSLRSEQRAVAIDQQVLEESVAGLSSPQYLAANAAALGMVTGQAPNYLRLSDNSVTGNGAAGAGSSVNALGPHSVTNALIANVPLVTDPSTSLGAGQTADDELLADNPTPPAITDGLPTPDTH